MKNKVILFSLACATVLSAQTIKSIDFVNLNKISPKIINETLDLKVGDQLDFQKLNNAIKTFYSYGYFTDILAEEENGNLRILFEEKPSIAKVDIKGYKTRAEDIDALKTMINLKKGAMYTNKRVEDAKKTLLDMLENEGFINSVVEIEVEELNKHSVSLTFNVNKGDEIIIKKANYYGADKLDQDDFDHVTANKEKEFASWWFGQNDGEVKADQLKYDARRINELYFEKGYLDAKVKEPYLDIDFASNQAKLDFFIEEGTKYTTNDIKIYVDESIVKADDLYPELKLIVGNTFNIKKLRQDQDYIKTQVANKGYAFADVRFDIKKEKDDSKVDVIFNVIPGKQVYINDVKISGNSRTLDRVIRRNVYLAPGDLYNLTDFKDSKNKLKRSGFFEDVIIEEKRVSEDKVDILVKVTEAATGSLMLGGGYGSYDKLMVNAAISDKNVFGSGIGASLSTELSAHQSDFSLQLTNPAIFDSKYNATIDIHSNESEIDRDNYESTKTVKGFTVGVGREIVRNLYAGAKYRLDFIKEDYTWDSDFAKPAIDGDGNPLTYLEDADYTTSSITPYINFDNTDDFYIPREGFKIGTSLEYAGIGGDSKYVKSSSYLKYFYSIEDLTELDWIFRFKTQVKVLVDNGQINQGDSLYLGGTRSLRGFKSYAFGPNNEDGEVEEPYKYMFANSVEMSFPLIPTANMRWAIFADYGSIGVDDFSKDSRVSTGALLEWISPFGPLQLIFARPLNDKPGDETSSFEFSLGAAF
ncbi:outer membrane protein assembly factor BamA [Malaciobacter pacificus]|uniref:Outer membrane protein assembly factor BamA n=1 Tax=Malaciobacter pacificus TaxID=1080223 RepID=A0A5C2H6E3_9BACT|nr:outer membrane protein assembly factor BamA [Malaciobacter pacificus]QEP34530.1 beta-barrel assembly machinery complex, BamA/YaeT protein [Malaciobacter pacificus]GGD33777.1 outer membrane protein assembly factor BamA [Malaciobacter pacificus]